MKSKLDQRFRWKGQWIKTGLRRGNIPSTEIVQFSFTESNAENYGSILDLLTLRWSKSQDPRVFWSNACSLRERLNNAHVPGAEPPWTPRLEFKSIISDGLKYGETSLLGPGTAVSQAEWSWWFGGRRCNFDTSLQIRAAGTNSNHSFRQTRKMITSRESFVTFVLHSTLTDVARSRTSSRHGGTKQNCQVRSASGL